MKSIRKPNRKRLDPSCDIFSQDLISIGIKPEFCPYIFYNIIEKHYSEPTREYHNLNHVLRSRRLLDETSEYVQNKNNLAVAIWFHDIIYDPAGQNNETNSAEIATNCLKQYGNISNSEVEKLILCTDYISHKPRTNDEMLMVDIDFSILGTDEKEYIQYSNGILKEREHLNIKPEYYFEKRLQFLQHIINREKIFFTKCFKERFEEKARKNITNEIKIIRHILGRENQITWDMYANTAFRTSNKSFEIGNKDK